MLPDGSTWYVYSPRNGWGAPTTAIETYTKTDGSIGTRTNTFVYDSAGIDLLIVTNALGVRVSSNSFNAYHQVLTNYDALNQATVYTYDASHRLSSMQTPGGLLTTNIYGADGHLSSSVDSFVGGSALRTNSYTWNADGTLRSHTDPRGLAVTNYWDNLQRLTGALYPDNTTVSNIYTYLDVTATKDRLTNWTYYGYDALRRKIAETNANNVVTRFGYCDCGALRYVTNAFGNALQEVTSFDYDLQGNRTFIFRPDGTVVTNWFDSLQRPSATADSIGTRWFGYNNQGLLTSITNGVGIEQRTVFDAEDRAYSFTDANGVTVTNTYDNLGRLLTRTYPDSGAEKFGYSALGLIKYTNQLNLVTSYGYDAALRKTAETNANNEVIRYGYNAASDLLTLVDGKSQTNKWNYDQYGRVTNKVDQANVEILRYSYDANSRLTNRWSKAMGNTAYTYDNVGNLTLVNYPASPDIMLQYDALNRLTNMIDAVGTNTYTYWPGGSLHTDDGPWSNDTVSYTNNSAGLRQSLTLQQPTGTWSQTYAYDAARRLSNTVSAAGTFVYTYQGAGKLVQKLSLPNKSYITNAYDNVARLTGTYLTHSNATVLNKHEYLYNAGNQRIRHTRTDNSYVTNTYENIGQLNSAVGSGGQSTESLGYKYDAAWNLNQRTNSGTPYTFSVDGKNQLTNDPSYADYYDDNGNLTTRSNGVYLAYTYSYDDENQLSSVAYADGSQPTSAWWRNDFVYDGRGRLRRGLAYTWVIVGTNGNWSLGGETHYHYDGNLVIQERISGTGYLPQVGYTRGIDLSGTLQGAGGIGGMLERSSGSGLNTHYFYHADGNGNITALEDSSQTVAGSYRYDPYGNTIFATPVGPAAANVYRFSSKPRYTSDGMYYYGYRWYDPNLQRWPNRDPLGERGWQQGPRTEMPYVIRAAVIDFVASHGGANLYRYCMNEPLRFFDPFGLSACTDMCDSDANKFQDKVDRTAKKATIVGCVSFGSAGLFSGGPKNGVQLGAIGGALGWLITFVPGTVGNAYGLSACYLGCLSVEL